MNFAVKYPYALPAVFLWIGFIGAISFMEAWLKFSAPGITVPLGLGIGRLVFAALNIMEWVFAAIIITNLLWGEGSYFSKGQLIFLIPFLLLLLQTVWLLPAMDYRAELVIENATVGQSYLHYYYVAFEIIKVSCLFIFGFNLYKK